MTILSPYTFSETIGNNADIWILHISRWGNRGASSIAGDLVYSGAIPAGVQAVAIGPQSTVSEAIIDCNLVGPFAIVQATPVPGGLIEGSLIVAGGAPLGPLAGSLSVRVAMQGQYGDTYIRDNATGTSAFGATESLFENPELQLIFYGGRARVTSPGRRAPMIRRATATIPDSGTTQTLLAIYPVSGRGAKRVSARATGTLIGSVNVGLISYIVTTPVATPVVLSSEAQSANIAVDGTTGAVNDYTSSDPCQFLAVYFTRTSGTGDVQAIFTSIDPPV